MSNCSPSSKLVENATYFCSVLPVVAVVLGGTIIAIIEAFQEVHNIWGCVSVVQWFGFYDPGQGKVKHTLQESALYKKVSDTWFAYKFASI